MILRKFLSACPFVAILRGVTPEQAPAIVETLAKAGFRIIEVPLNSPRPYDSIEVIARQFGKDLLVGAGTVLVEDEVDTVYAAGGELIVSPNFNAAVVGRAKILGLTSLPGVATPSEAFAALAAGADGLKMFPAETMPPKVVKAWRAVLPRGTLLLPVGGILPDNAIVAYLDAGADGFGLGSALYRHGTTLAEIRTSAEAFVARAASSGD